MTGPSEGGRTPRRRALLLGCGTYADPAYPSLRAAYRDIDLLGEVLADSRGCGYEVTTRVDCTAHQAQRAIEGFFASARPSDVHLLYLSCHGIQSPRGDLHFAFGDTRPDLLGSTSVSAEWVRGQISASRSRTTIVLVDCCFSGGFLRGMRARSGVNVNVAALVRDLPEGNGVAVLTASGETEFSFEELGEQGAGADQPSYFTEAVVTGIRSGAADRNGDGLITVDELYDYVYQRIVEGPSPQRPRRMRFGEGEVVIAAVATPLPPRALPLPGRPPRPVRGVEPRTPPPETPAPVPVLSTPAASTPAMTARGLLGSVTFDGQWITVTKSGFGPAMKGEQRIHLSHVVDADIRFATRLYHGYIRFGHVGRRPRPLRRGGRLGGRPPMDDPDSLSFPHKANDAFAALHSWIQAARTHADAARSSTHRTAAERDPIAAYSTGHGHSAVIAHTAAPTSSPVRQSPPTAPAYVPPVTRWGWAARILLWLATAFFAFGEVVAIVATITNTWPERTVEAAIVGNLCYSVPLALLIWAVVADVRRTRRRRRT